MRKQISTARWRSVGARARRAMVDNQAISCGELEHLPHMQSASARPSVGPGPRDLVSSVPGNGQSNTASFRGYLMVLHGPSLAVGDAVMNHETSPDRQIQRAARRSFFTLFSVLLLAACPGTGIDEDGPTTDPACQLDTKSEKTPGYPYNVDKFTSDVLPVITTSCGAAGCHGAPAGNGGYTVYASAAPGSCDFAKTFNSVAGKIDLATPPNSRLLAAVSGGAPGHPFTFPAGAPGLATLGGFIDTAAASYAADGGGTTPPPGPSPFDYAIYQSQIQPALDAASCAKAGCHGSGAGGFTLKPTPAAASDDMKANFLAVTSRTNLDDPAKSLLYARATVLHSGGGSTLIAAGGATQMLTWITTAKANAGSGGGNPTCAPVAAFNLGVFSSEVMPILQGALDLNVVGGVGRGAGCTSSVCHGVDRGPGKFSLPPAADGPTLLQNFACFVDLTSPSTSEVVVCPSNSPGCRRSPHPGQEVFRGADDLNYQRLLAFIYGSKTNVSPLDYAFFVRKINPIFNDINAVEGGAQNRTCADSACHGISVAGQAAPNGSDFPILSNASGDARLSFNFVTATGFVNFLSPGESSLFLYPTNEIANRADHRFATGLPHPGGTDFAVDSAEAQAILHWAAGLRPDASGFQHNWLVLGDFAATQISDQTLVNEATTIPKIFDPGGGSFNRGQWDGLFADTSDVDLNAAFPRTATSGRAAYAVSYVLNTAARQQVIQIGVATTNPVRIYVNGQLVAQNDQGGGATAITTLSASGAGRSARIMIKLLQRATDNRFAFTAQLRDEQGILLTDRNGGLVFTLGPNGGI